MKARELEIKMKAQGIICSECGCDMRTKYLIRVDFDAAEEFNFAGDDVKKKIHFQATTRRSIVGWIKHVCNEYGNFEEIQIKIKLSELLCLRNQFKDEKHEELTEFEGEVD